MTPAVVRERIRSGERSPARPRPVCTACRGTGRVTRHVFDEKQGRLRRTVDACRACGREP